MCTPVYAYERTCVAHMGLQLPILSSSGGQSHCIIVSCTSRAYCKACSGLGNAMMNASCGGKRTDQVGAWLVDRRCAMPRAGGGLEKVSLSCGGDQARWRRQRHDVRRSEGDASGLTNAIMNASSENEIRCARAHNSGRYSICCRTLLQACTVLCVCLRVYPVATGMSLSSEGSRCMMQRCSVCSTTLRGPDDRRRY